MEVDITQPRPNKVGEETSAQVPEPKGTKDILPRGKKAIEDATDTGAEAELKIPHNGDSASKDPLERVEIGDSSLFPSISNSMIHDAQDAEAYHGGEARGEEDLFRSLFAGVEDVSGLSDLEVLKKSWTRLPRVLN